MSKSAGMLQFFFGLCIIRCKQYEVRVKGSTPINIWPPLPQCLPQGAQAMWFQIRFKSWKLDLKLCQHCVWVRGNVCQAGQSSSPPQKSRSHWVPPQPSREAHEGKGGTGICQNLNQLIFAIWNFWKPFQSFWVKFSFLGSGKTSPKFNPVSIHGKKGINQPQSSMSTTLIASAAASTTASKKVV